MDNIIVNASAEGHIDQADHPQSKIENQIRSKRPVFQVTPQANNHQRFILFGVVSQFISNHEWNFCRNLTTYSCCED